MFPLKSLKGPRTNNSTMPQLSAVFLYLQTKNFREVYFTVKRNSKLPKTP